MNDIYEIDKWGASDEYISIREKILKSWKGKYNKKLIDSYNKAIIKSLKKFCELDDE